MVAKSDFQAKVEAYKKDLLSGAEEIKQLMLQTWGVAPEVEFSVEPAMIVRANFNMKGFQHNGAKKYLDAKTMAGYRKPFLMAAEIMGEVVTHRNTCADCGEDIPSIAERYHHALCILDSPKAYKGRFNSKNGTHLYRLVDRANSKMVVVQKRAVIKNGKVVDQIDEEREYIRYKEVYLPLILPDFVEIMLMPRMSKVIGRASLIAKKKGWEVREAAVCQVKQEE